MTSNSSGASGLFGGGRRKGGADQSQSQDCGFELGYEDVQEDLDRICLEAATCATQYAAVSRTIWLRLEDCRMFNWKHGLRGLQLLHCMLLQGPPAMLSEALAHYPLIQALTEVRALPPSPPPLCLSSLTSDL